MEQEQSFSTVERERERFWERHKTNILCKRKRQWGRRKKRDLQRERQWDREILLFQSVLLKKPLEEEKINCKF